MKSAWSDLSVNPELVQQVELDVNTELHWWDNECHWQVEHLHRTNQVINPEQHST